VLYEKGAGPTAAGAEGAASEAGASAGGKAPEDDVIEGEFEVKK
jgi:hypothetical protein